MTTVARGYDGGPFLVEMCPHGCSDPSDCDSCIAIMAERQKAGPEACNCTQALALKAELADARGQIERLNILLDPKLLEMHLENGTLETCVDGKGLVKVMAHAFWSVLTESKAENYVTMTLERGERALEIIIQKRAKKTAHDLRREAEAQLKESAAHLGDVLALGSSAGLKADGRRTAAREWLTAYLARLAKEGT